MVYFSVDDIESAHRVLTERGVSFRDGPHVVHRTEGSELHMAFFTDPDGNNLALMAEVPVAQTDG
jgi:catechol 2,3-dioxygenase-like lactoylglutathione lyase family enzyme